MPSRPATASAKFSRLKEPPTISDIELAVESSRDVEQHLRATYRAKGKGLHSLVSSAKSHLTEQQIKDLRFVASVRNTVVHEAASLTDDKRRRLREIADAFVSEPGPFAGGKTVRSWRALPAIVLLVVMITLYIVFVR